MDTRNTHDIRRERPFVRYKGEEDDWFVLIDSKFSGIWQGLYNIIFSNNWCIIDLNQVSPPKLSFPPFHFWERGPMVHIRQVHMASVWASPKVHPKHVMSTFHYNRYITNGRKWAILGLKRRLNSGSDRRVQPSATLRCLVLGVGFFKLFIHSSNLACFDVLTSLVSKSQ